VSWAELRGDVAIVACAISAGIHAALVPEHLEESAASGVGFAASAVLLAVLCVGLTYRPSHVAPLAAAAALLVALLAAYALAVTSGVPYLHPEAEPVDGLALVTKAVELTGLAVALDIIRRRGDQPFRRSSSARREMF
jgi:drug/metabolite transporter (DMT)-like permease